VLQACVLCAALAESHPGAIESAVARIPRRARRHFARALEAATRVLADHPRAREELSG
jgi:plasmid stabilization system protein ParE